MENYKIVPQSPGVTTVEITVVEKLTEKSTSGPIQIVEAEEKGFTRLLKRDTSRSDKRLRFTRRMAQKWAKPRLQKS